jgi:hypothetical protein
MSVMTEQRGYESDGRERDEDDVVPVDEAEPSDLDDLDGDSTGDDVSELTELGSLGATEEPDAEDALLDSWADDADALGTETGGFGPDRPRDARIPGIYSLDEIDDVSVIGDVHDDDLVGQGDEEN